jgi:hypothetical protein
MFRYASAVFLGAFLLFQVQPILGKSILPWFGGGPAVWLTCMLFFQVCLLGGYLYAHLLGTRVPRRAQPLLHVALLLASLSFLPIAPSAAWKPESPGMPVARILGLLTVSVGAPFLLASSTGPLLQRWFAWTRPGASPYRLYALSNAASLLGLISYPFLLEPRLGLRAQTDLWSAGYIAFVAASVWCAFALHRAPCSEVLVEPRADDPSATAGQSGRWLLWLALPTCGSVLLLATTNQMTQYLPPTPFLWVLPLGLYLLSFVASFDSPRWYDRRFWVPAMLLCMPAAALIARFGGAVPIRAQVAVYSAAVFVGCMICHGELYRLRPPPRRLTAFYLTVATGGAMGGVLTTVVAQSVFDGYHEFPLVLFATYVLFAIAATASTARPQRRRTWAALALGGAYTFGATLAVPLLGSDGNTIASTRNFYGVLSVHEFDADTSFPYRELWHGRVLHGVQYLRGKPRKRALSYFGPNSGLAHALQHLRAGDEQRALDIGAVGLGVGSVAALAGLEDRLRFYEINPRVLDVARTYFHYLEDTEAATEIVLGDARISLERELAEGWAQGFDLLVLDAFNSDTVPAHLLTREAMAVYRGHLRPQGILAFHVTTDHLDLAPLVLGLARDAGLDALLFVNQADPTWDIERSEWVLVAERQLLLDDRELQLLARHWPDESRPIVWTDDYGGLLQVVRR